MYTDETVNSDVALSKNCATTDASFALVVLAAGLGSRYGGLKQMEGFGPSRAALLEYSVFDAVRAGCNRVVFVVREEFREEFTSTLAAPLAAHVEVKVVVQEPGLLPGGFAAPADRVKPYGTVQALLAASEFLDRPFVLVNADDFYGLEALTLAAAGVHRTAADGVMVSYPLASTLSEFSPVTRGVCQVENSLLVSIDEVGGLSAVGGVPRSADLKFAADTPTSVNLFGFRPAILETLEGVFKDFLGSTDLTTGELPVSSAVGELLSTGSLRIEVLTSSGGWFGVTVREDKPGVDEHLGRLIREGAYPLVLWGNS